jgi:hypothetical protein
MRPGHAKYLPEQEIEEIADGVPGNWGIVVLEDYLAVSTAGPLVEGIFGEVFGPQVIGVYSSTLNDLRVSRMHGWDGPQKWRDKSRKEERDFPRPNFQCPGKVGGLRSENQLNVELACNTAQTRKDLLTEDNSTQRCRNSLKLTNVGTSYFDFRPFRQKE